MEQRSDAMVLRRGTLDPEELAALAAVLHQRATAQPPESSASTRHGRRVATWRGPEQTAGYHGPRTWRTGPI
ncbi:acyl-CoA carboxylase subunit epsilon [Streptacidiphilus sp. PAMC 29251]